MLNTPVSAVVFAALVFGVSFGTLRWFFPLRNRRASPMGRGGPAEEGDGGAATVLGLEIPVLMRVVLSVVLLVVAVVVVLGGNRFGEAAHAFATGTAGTIIGYWFPK